MLAPSSFSPEAEPVRATYVVDLIGDLDGQLARSFTDSIRRLCPSAGERVVVHLRHVAQADAVGAAILAVAVEGLRSAGCDLAVVAGNKRIRTLLRTAKIETAIGYATDRFARVRHIMIVRNSDPTRDCA